MGYATERHTALYRQWWLAIPSCWVAPYRQMCNPFSEARRLRDGLDNSSRQSDSCASQVPHASRMCNGCGNHQPTMGSTWQWLVNTGGDLDADRVARALGLQLGVMVAGGMVTAMHPDTDNSTDMVAVLMPADQASALRAMAAIGCMLYVYGRECRILHMTILRRGNAQMRRGPTHTDRASHHGIVSTQ